MHAKNTIFALGLILGLGGCEGPEGPRGPTGDSPDPADVATAITEDDSAIQKISDDLADRHADKLGTPDTPEQILEKLTTVDGPQSGLDADTLDGAELSALEARIAALESQVQELKSKNDEEILYAFDGEDRILGRVISFELDSLVFFDKEAGIPVEAFVEVIGQSETLQEPKLLFYSDDCTGEIYLFTESRTSRFVGVLENSTGTIYAPTGLFDGGGGFDSSRSLLDPSATCQSESKIGTFHGYEVKRTISPFTPGVYVGPLP